MPISFEEYQRERLVAQEKLLTQVRGRLEELQVHYQLIPASHSLSTPEPEKAGSSEKGPGPIFVTIAERLMSKGSSGWDPLEDLTFILSYPKDTERRLELRSPKDAEYFRNLFFACHQLNQELDQRGQTLSNRHLTFRAVKAEDVEELDNIALGALVNGGKNSNRGDLPGVCVDGGGRFRKHAHLGKGGTTILIYDEDKLVLLSKAEQETDSSFFGGYGVKAGAGFELRDAVLAVIKIVPDRQVKMLETKKEEYLAVDGYYLQVPMRNPLSPS